MRSATCFWVYILYRSSKYSFHILRTSSSPCPNLPFPSFILLQLSSFCITHLLPNQFLTSIHILIHLPSKLLIYFLFALVYTPFNLSLFFFVCFLKSFFCLFITFHLLTVAFTLSFNHTLFRFFSPTITEPHTSFELSTITFFTYFHMCLILFSPSHAILFP